MVFPEMLGVVKVVTPVPPVRTDPPEAAAYQSSVSPEEAAPDKATVPGPQFEPGVVEEIVGLALIVARTPVLAAEIHVVAASRACA